MTKKVTIHKKNEIVRGTDEYSINAKRALNAIYWALQKYDYYKHDYVPIRFATLKDTMGLQNVEDYVQRIKEAMQELRKPLELNNFYHPIQQKKFDWYSLSFLDEVGFPKEDKERVAVIKVNPFMKHLMQLDGNFTKMELIPYANKFRTKYAMKMYEYLKSFESYYYLDICDEHMRKLLNIQDIKKYQYFSTLSQLVERQMKEITSKSDLNEVTFKAIKVTKTFRFLINKKSKKNAGKAEAKATLDNLIKRI